MKVYGKSGGQEVQRGQEGQGESGESGDWEEGGVREGQGIGGKVGSGGQGEPGGQGVRGVLNPGPTYFMGPFLAVQWPKRRPQAPPQLEPKSG